MDGAFGLGERQSKSVAADGASDVSEGGGVADGSCRLLSVGGGDGLCQCW